MWYYYAELRNWRNLRNGKVPGGGQRMLPTRRAALRRVAV